MAIFVVVVRESPEQLQPGTTRFYQNGGLVYPVPGYRYQRWSPITPLKRSFNHTIRVFGRTFLPQGSDPPCTHWHCNFKLHLLLSSDGNPQVHVPGTRVGRADTKCGSVCQMWPSAQP
eukprot:2810942-Rhodomonas_salina.4